MAQFYRFALLASILCAIGFGAGGVYLLHVQRTALLRFRPIPATVEYSQERHNRRGCQLRLRFRYEVAGQEYVSSQATPAGRSASCALADSLPVGLDTTAYYRPGTPAEAFLIRTVALIPHISMMLAVLLGLAAFWLVVDHGAELSGRRATPRLQGKVWQVRPERRTGQRADLAFWTAAIWIPVALLLLADYFGQDGQWNTASGVTVVCVALVSAGSVIMAVYYRLLVRKVSEAVVTVSEYPLRRGERFVVRARQRALAAVEVQELAIRFVCERREVSRRGGTHSINTEPLYEDRQAGFHNEPASKGQPIEASFEFIVPEEAEGTTSLDSDDTVEWFLEVRTRLKASPDYVMRHPLVMESV